MDSLRRPGYPGNPFGDLSIREGLSGTVRIENGLFARATDDAKGNGVPLHRPRRHNHQPRSLYGSGFNSTRCSVVLDIQLVGLNASINAQIDEALVRKSVPELS